MIVQPACLTVRLTSNPSHCFCLSLVGPEGLEQVPISAGFIMQVGREFRRMCSHRFPHPAVGR
jgi:hypothetical protein